MAGIGLTPASPPVSWQSRQLLPVGMWARPIGISASATPTAAPRDCAG